MAVTRAQKQTTLTELNDKFGRAKGIVFAQFGGLSVENTQAMRRALRASNVDYKVARKTLIRLAAKDAGYDIPTESLQGPIGVAFGYDDEIVAAQKMAEFAKKFEAIQLAGGIMEGKIIDAKMVMTLASIPSRDVLLAKFMGSAMSPLTGFVGVLGNVLGSFVRVVNAYKDQRESGAPAKAEPVVETAPAEEPKAEVATEPTAEALKEEVAEPTAEEPVEEAPKEEVAEPAAEAPKEEVAPEPTAEPAPEEPAAS